MAKILIGTSGWTYTSWKGRFYPDDLPSRDYLEFYTKEFPTTEVNYSFYHLPKRSTYERWRAQVPTTFLFAVKASRFITHIKRLHDAEDAWRLFVENASALGPRLGPILFQFPPFFRADPDRLGNFLERAQVGTDRTRPLQLVCEFRHDSWFTEEIYELLHQYGVALCIADGAKYARRDVITSDFAYIRYHGRNRMFASDYTDKELAAEAAIIKRFRRRGLNVFVYFNNDAMGYAVKNARTLMRYIQGTPAGAAAQASRRAANRTRTAS